MRIAAFFMLLTLIGSSMAQAQDGHFLFVTFRGEATPDTEQVYFAISSDGHNWQALNRGRPVLKSELGEKGVRDPYLLRSHDGKRYFLIGTDLSIALNRDWGRAATRGSRAIIVWESEDLVHWSDPRRVEIAADDAGCTWAPEAVYDEEAADYLVFWASRNAADNFAKFRIWACHTKDFKDFGKPFVFIEKSYPVIDTTIVREGGRYYRFTKDEHDAHIVMESSDKLNGEWTEVDAFNLGSLRGVEGPECYLLRPPSGTTPGKWCLILDHYGKGQGYKAYVTDHLATAHFEPLAAMKFPFPFRHGCVLSISPEQYARLKREFPGESEKN